MMKFSVFYSVALLLIASSIFQVSRCESEFHPLGRYFIEDSNHTAEQSDFNTDEFFSSMVDTTINFSKESCRFLRLGKEYKFLIEMKNNGKSELVIVAAFVSVHLPNTTDSDHHFVYKLEPQTFINQRVRPSTTWTFTFIINKDLKVGKYELMGTVLYFMNHTPLYTTFHDGRFEVVETESKLLVGMVSVYIILGVLLLLRCIILLYKIQVMRDNLVIQNERRAREEAEAEVAKNAEDVWFRQGETMMNLEASTSYSRSKSKSKSKSKLKKKAG